jgi:hypothetical protein
LVEVHGSAQIRRQPERRLANEKYVINTLIHTLRNAPSVWTIYLGTSCLGCGEFN